MKAYWDSSALVATTIDAGLKARLASEGAFARTHSLAEVFSALTGKLHIRASANEAPKAVRLMSDHIDFIDLSTEEILHGLARAQSLGVRGGRVHDYLHALCAIKSGAHSLLTTDENDFDGLTAGLSVVQV